MAFADPEPCTVVAREDFTIQVSSTGTIDVNRGEQFVGKIYGSYAKINIDGVWYRVSRNKVTVLSSDSDLDLE